MKNQIAFKRDLYIQAESCHDRAVPPAEQQAQPGAVYAELPEPDFGPGRYLGKATGDAYTKEQLRDFADRTHALRMQAAPKAAPVAQAASSQSEAATELPPITNADRQFLHDNPNTDDLVKWVQNYAGLAIALASSAQQPYLWVSPEQAAEIADHPLPNSASVPEAEDLSSYGAQLLEENGRKVLSYWPYCAKCHKPFEFEKEEPFASCGCPGSTEWGDPRPASWVQSPAPNARLEAAPQQEAQEPALFVSAKQLAALTDPDDPDGEHGRYLPVRKTTKGLFTQALYTAPQPAPALLARL